MPSAITLDRSAHAATNSKPFASTWAPDRGPRAREKSGDGWISPKLNLVVNGDDGETATRKWAWAWISQMAVLTTPSSSLPRILIWEYHNLQWPTVQYVIPPNKGCFHSNSIGPSVVRGMDRETTRECPRVKCFKILLYLCDCLLEWHGGNGESFI